MTAERIDMIRKSEYDELAREHLETRGEIVKLESKLQSLLDWRKQAIEGWSKDSDEIEQVLGKVLGYPWYKDDPENFPDATEADGVFVGEHVPASIAAEAATKIKALQAKLKAAEEALVKANAQEAALYVENSQLRIMLRECRPCVAAIGTVELLDCVDQMIGGEVHAG